MSPKLTYFNAKGLAELVRLLCKYGDVEFEDVRFEREQWPELKATTPFGQVPLWEENGKVVSQSVAIARYIAKKVKLVGANDWENLEIDAIVDTITDLRLKFTPIFYEQDETKKAALLKTFLEETLSFYLDRFEKMAGSGHLVGNKLTWADFNLVILNDGLTVVTGKAIDSKYVNLYKVIENVISIPQIKKWMEIRPITPT